MSTAKRIAYGYSWPADIQDLEIEFNMIEQQLYKDTPLPHYLAIDRILWPEDDQHRWFTLAMENLCQNTVTALIGPADSGKTYPAAKWALIEYWTSPNDTLVLVSSTDVRGLELRVWGAIKDLFNRAIELHPHLPGTALDSKHAITTDKIVEDGRKARVLRKGIICIPCMQSGRYVGLGKYVGVKQRRLRQVGDEVQLMGPTFLDAVPNFLGKDYKAAFLGNPLEPTDCLGRVAEPITGWDNHPEPETTDTWQTRFHGGRCVNFVGTDSPNFDYDRDQPPRYPYMINWRKIEAVIDFWGKDSIQYYSQCKGVMRFGLVGNRVITQQMCREHKAHDLAVWRGTGTTQLFAVDPSYGGEDRCIAGRIEFGQSSNETNILKVYTPEVVPVVPGTEEKPELQIAKFCKQRMDSYGIPPSNCFYDATGKGTMGESWATVFGSNPPVAVESGGNPTKRAVRNDLFTNDEKIHTRRLKRCDEHYSKFVTEMWFSVRNIIECNQMRELPLEVMLEGCLREYGLASGNRIQLEKKEDTRKRMGKSPDLFDWLAIAVEGARQLGFVIESTGNTLIDNDPSQEWDDAEEDFDKVIQKALLQHV
jgi:hypothetical protein